MVSFKLTALLVATTFSLGASAIPQRFGVGSLSAGRPWFSSPASGSSGAAKVVEMVKLRTGSGAKSPVSNGNNFKSTPGPASPIKLAANAGIKHAKAKLIEMTSFNRGGHQVHQGQGQNQTHDQGQAQELHQGEAQDPNHGQAQDLNHGQAQEVELSKVAS
ncbi:hypothetical protein RSAG8_11512, partial [Rhizoctonia solani AG-8 WAC10335]